MPACKLNTWSMLVTICVALHASSAVSANEPMRSFSQQVSRTETGDGRSWRIAAAMHRAQMAAVRTLSIRYHGHYAGISGSGPADFDVAVLMSGGLYVWPDKFSGRIYTRFVRTSADSVLQGEASLDGLNVYTRRLSPGVGTLAIHGPEEPVLSFPLPHQIIMYDTLGQLPGGERDTGDYVLVSAEPQADGTTLFEFRQRAIRRTLRLWCDPRVGHLPIRLAQFAAGSSPGAGVEGAARVVDAIEYHKFNDRGNSVYYPVTGEQRIYGKLHMNFRVDPGDVHLNAQIPDDAFVLTAKDDEFVVTAGQQRVLRQPLARSSGGIGAASAAPRTSDGSSHDHGAGRRVPWVLGACAAVMLIIGITWRRKRKGLSS